MEHANFYVRIYRNKSMCKNICVCVYTHICLYFQKEKVNNNLPGYLHGKRDYMGWRDTNSS